MQGQPVKRVVIAGGGTAGWSVAAALAQQLGPLLEITLVESDDIGIVGVGEATIPTFRSFHALLGIEEREFMRATQASFKLGIQFENWGQQGDRYIHPFGDIGKSSWMADFHHMWLMGKARGFAGDPGDYCFEHQAALAGKFAVSDKTKINYAYHLDASLYARFLRGIFEPKGVKRIEGKITRVEQDGESGYVTALLMENGERVGGDLFVDCTGLRGLLIEQTLAAGYEDWRHWLQTDSALAVPTKSTGSIPPYTRSLARSAGWQWRIPLQHRVGNGLVSSTHQSQDQARRIAGQPRGKPLAEPRLIRYVTGAGASAGSRTWWPSACPAASSSRSRAPVSTSSRSAPCA
jgi:tryptophan halogenase